MHGAARAGQLSLLIRSLGSDAVQSAGPTPGRHTTLYLRARHDSCPHGARGLTTAAFQKRKGRRARCTVPLRWLDVAASSSRAIRSNGRTDAASRPCTGAQPAASSGCEAQLEAPAAAGWTVGPRSPWSLRRAAIGFVSDEIRLSDSPAMRSDADSSASARYGLQREPSRALRATEGAFGTGPRDLVNRVVRRVYPTGRRIRRPGGGCRRCAGQGRVALAPTHV